jgi:hypothetical protein
MDGPVLLADLRYSLENNAVSEIIFALCEEMPVHFRLETAFVRVAAPKPRSFSLFYMTLDYIFCVQAMYSIDRLPLLLRHK